MSNSEKVKSSQLSLRGFLAGVQGLEPWALGFGVGVKIFGPQDYFAQLSRL